MCPSRSQSAQPTILFRVSWALLSLAERGLQDWSNPSSQSQMVSRCRNRCCSDSHLKIEKKTCKEKKLIHWKITKLHFLPVSRKGLTNFHRIARQLIIFVFIRCCFQQKGVSLILKWNLYYFQRLIPSFMLSHFLDSLCVAAHKHWRHLRVHVTPHSLIDFDGRKLEVNKQ